MLSYTLTSTCQVGFVIDRFKRPSLVIMLFALSSLLTMFGYTWFTLPPDVTGTPVPAIASIGAGIGFSPRTLLSHHLK